MKKFFKNIPIEINHDEYMILANTLYASFQAMVSNNNMVYLIDIETKKVYGFDEVLEIDKIKEYGAKTNFHLLQLNFTN